MPENYGEDDYSSGAYSGGLQPIIDSKFIEYFPSILPREPSSVFRRYIDTYGDAFNGLDSAMSYVKQSHDVTEANGRDLQQIGALYGEIGRQGTRSEEEYRAYIQSLLNSFNARGTVAGLKFAIAAAVDTDVDNVEIVEDFDNNEYEIELRNVNSKFLSSTVNDLAELADPSGVELSSAPVVFITGDEYRFEATESSVISSASGLGSGEVTFDGNNQLG